MADERSHVCGALMRSRKFLAIAACTALASVSAIGSAHAAQFGLYVGGFYGDASKDVTQEPFDRFAAAIWRNDIDYEAQQILGVTLDEKESTYGFLVGYRLTPYLAVEGGYMDLGKVTYRNLSSGVIGDDPLTLSTNFTSDTSGLAASVLGIWPISFRWEAYGRGGVLIATNDMDVYLTDGAQALAGQISESSTDLLAGVGLSFSFAEIYQARFEFQRVFDAGDDVAGEADVDLVTFGITVTF